MNSREAAAYEESLQEVLDASVLDTGPGGDASLKDSPSLVGDAALLDHTEVEPSTRRKRKRTDEETCVPVLFFLILIHYHPSLISFLGHQVKYKTKTICFECV